MFHCLSFRNFANFFSSVSSACRRSPVGDFVSLDMVFNSTTVRQAVLHFNWPTECLLFFLFCSGEGRVMPRPTPDPRRTDERSLYARARVPGDSEGTQQAQVPHVLWTQGAGTLRVLPS